MNSREIFVKNLNRLLENSGKTQVEVATALGVSKSTLNGWVTGYSFPRIDKIQALADIFNVPKSDLIEVDYLEEIDVKKATQEMVENPEAWKLFMACKSLSGDDMKLVKNLIDRLRSDK